MKKIRFYQTWDANVIFMPVIERLDIRKLTANGHVNEPYSAVIVNSQTYVDIMSLCRRYEVEIISFNIAKGDSEELKTLVHNLKLGNNPLFELHDYIAVRYEIQFSNNVAPIVLTHSSNYYTFHLPGDLRRAYAKNELLQIKNALNEKIMINPNNISYVKEISYEL